MALPNVVLDLNAGMAGLALPEEAKQKMLHVDDEIAGLIEAADMPADQAGAHRTKPELVSPVAGELICEDAAILAHGIAD